MKQSNHNDVDLLLRALARGEEQPWAGEKSVVSDHLDADELNLYAEGVLPAPARARYTEHLADCRRCRTLAVGLAQAAGRTVQQETTSQQSGASFWRSMATLFSLPVLRYALPALVLAVVIAIGLTNLREQRSTDFAARNQQMEPPVLDQASEAPANASNSPSASPSSVLHQQEIDANTASSAPKNNPVDSSGLLADKSRSNTGGITTDGTAAKDAAESPHVAGAVTSRPMYAPEPAPPPKAAEVNVTSAARKEELDERETMNRQQGEVKLLSKDDSPTHGPARSRTMSAGSRRDADAAAENRAARSKAKKQVAEEVETRTVSGRRFRREGNAWVDTAVDPSRGATNVSRGSEQFRALMADEPGLRAIVQQFGGDVIVVWKNRAYRFR